MLQPLKAVQEQHADHGEREHAAQVRGPLLVGGGVDADHLVDAALDPPVLVRGEDVGHVIADGHTARAQSDDQQTQLEPASGGDGHQNLSGWMRARNR